MSAITTIKATIQTRDVSGAGHDSNVYLGIAGREFRLDTSADDYEQSSNRVYALGNGSNVKNPAENNPRDPALDTVSLDSYPTYIRYEPVSTDYYSSWNLESVKVYVNGALKYQVFFKDGFWMGSHCGKMCYLKKV